ncbi:helix-turn-helix transcriptional regulator [Prauserella endophytica]|uniref:Response regulator transcription factor n=1 Tax=Prauserella endophytica TaxID=1592324 RepID=A0ABY2S9P1_9PSEU|nr:LuxR C-terminal-related transcriptional regulator [Prauserella endophytica]PXY23055.1 helix-turn-helix transcriptional regulator [Prauserella coralliicola]TKG72552.1 response regulator transcription factor [Prauserella endophytica]
MPEKPTPPAQNCLPALRDVIDGPLHEIAGRFSRFLSDRWPHTALVIFTRECTGRPRKVAGDTETINKVTIGELERLKASVEPGHALGTTATIAGATRTVWAVQDPIGTLLVLIPRSARKHLPEHTVLADLFGIVATSIRQQVAQASPDYLAESRAASSERARTIAEMAAAQETALVTILTTLRSTRLDDHRARVAATESASSALVALRSAQKTDLALSEESASAAFTKLRKKIRQTLRHHDARLDFVPPATAARPLPGDIAHAARVMTLTAVLAFTAQKGLQRLRVAWQSDDTSLRIDVRDHESGSLDVNDLRHQLDGRARTLGATVELEAVPGWGSRMTIHLPFEPAHDHAGETRLESLNRRELEVLRSLTQGKRNKAIAAELGVTESTVKFHVAGVLKKLEVSSRGEAAAMAIKAGFAPHPL